MTYLQCRNYGRRDNGNPDLKNFLFSVKKNENFEKHPKHPSKFEPKL
jgi:hypothetical protein